MSLQRFCDCCGKEMAQDAKQHGFKLKLPTAAIRAVMSTGGLDVCLNCVIDAFNKLDTRPKPKGRERTSTKEMERAGREAVVQNFVNARLSFEEVAACVWRAMWDAWKPSIDLKPSAVNAAVGVGGVTEFPAVIDWHSPPGKGVFFTTTGPSTGAGAEKGTTAEPGPKRVSERMAGGFTAAPPPHHRPHENVAEQAPKEGRAAGKSLGAYGHRDSGAVLHIDPARYGNEHTFVTAFERNGVQDWKLSSMDIGETLLRVRELAAQVGARTVVLVRSGFSPVFLDTLKREGYRVLDAPSREAESLRRAHPSI